MVVKINLELRKLGRDDILSKMNIRATRLFAKNNQRVTTNDRCL